MKKTRMYGKVSNTSWAHLLLFHWQRANYYGCVIRSSNLKRKSTSFIQPQMVQPLTNWLLPGLPLYIIFHSNWLATHLLPGRAVSCAAFSQFPQCPTCHHAWLPPEREQDCLGQQPSCRSVPHERTHTGDSVNGSAQCTVVQGAAGRKKQ